MVEPKDGLTGQLARSVPFVALLHAPMIVPPYVEPLPVLGVRLVLLVVILFPLRKEMVQLVIHLCE